MSNAHLRRSLTFCAAALTLAMLAPTTPTTASDLPWTASVDDHRDDVRKNNTPPRRRSAGRDLHKVAVRVSDGTARIRLTFNDLRTRHLGGDYEPATSFVVRIVSGNTTTHIGWGETRPHLSGWRTVDGTSRDVSMGECPAATQHANVDRDVVVYRVPVSCLAQKRATSAKVWALVSWTNSRGGALYDPLTTRWDNRTDRYTPRFRIR